MAPIKTEELDNLVENYFGLDYDIVDDGDEIDAKVAVYNKRSGKPGQRVLLEDIEAFLALDGELDAVLKKRYSSYFLP